MGQVRDSSGSAVVHAHTLVAKVAREIANEQFEAVMKDNVLYKEFRRSRDGWTEAQLRSAFVQKYVLSPACLAAARATLGLMLTMPTNEALKETIAEALILDNTLKAGRG